MPISLPAMRGLPGEVVEGTTSPSSDQRFLQALRLDIAGNALLDEKPALPASSDSPGWTRTNNPPVNSRIGGYALRSAHVSMRVYGALRCAEVLVVRYQSGTKNDFTPVRVLPPVQWSSAQLRRTFASGSNSRRSQSSARARAATAPRSPFRAASSPRTAAPSPSPARVSAQ